MKLAVALIQMSCSENADGNLQHIEKEIAVAKAQNVHLVVLQELHNTPYFCQTEDAANFDLAEPIPGPSCEQLARLAQNNSMVIVASLFEKRATGLYHNTAVVFDSDGTIAGTYRKMHIPDDPGYYEKFYFTPGDLGFHPIKTSVGNLGVMLCWDQWFPEAARMMALADADILIYPTAIGWESSDSEDEKNRQLDAWTTVQRAHAVANGLPVLVCNRTGFEPDSSGVTDGIRFWGSSFIAGPQGEILAQAGTDKAELLIAQLDSQRSEAVRRIWPFLRDRRIDAYNDLLLRFRN
jgi:N-carbamoylputrescine amidase